MNISTASSSVMPFSLTYHSVISVANHSTSSSWKALPTWEDACYRRTNHPGGGLTLQVNASRHRPRFDVTADGRGMTGRSGTALVAEVADTIGLTSNLERVVNGCRSWSDHAPGKVVRDLVVMLADGGDALR